MYFTQINMKLNTWFTHWKHFILMGLAITRSTMSSTNIIYITVTISNHFLCHTDLVRYR